MSEHRSLVPPTDEILAELAMLERRRTEARKLLKLAQERDAHAPPPAEGLTIGRPTEPPSTTTMNGFGPAAIINKGKA